MTPGSLHASLHGFDVSAGQSLHGASAHGFAPRSVHVAPRFARFRRSIAPRVAPRSYRSTLTHPVLRVVSGAITSDNRDEEAKREPAARVLRSCRRAAVGRWSDRAEPGRPDHPHGRSPGHGRGHRGERGPRCVARAAESVAERLSGSIRCPWCLRVAETGSDRCSRYCVFVSIRLFHLCSPRP